MKTKLTDITDVVRSKNSGPYELTLDIMFKTFEDFEKVCAAKAINENLICDLYKITPDKIINIIEFKPAKSIKDTIKFLNHQLKKGGFLCLILHVCSKVTYTAFILRPVD